MGDTSGAINDDNGIGLDISWYLSVASNMATGDSTSWRAYDNNGRGYGQTADVASTTGDFYLTGVQLEVGDTATPFEHAISYGEQLALCQRYYQLIGIQDGQYDLANTLTNHAHRCAAPYLPVEMRATPTVTWYHWDTGTTGQLREFSSATTRTVSAYHGSGKNAGGYLQFSTNLSNPVIMTAKFDAEL